MVYAQHSSPSPDKVDAGILLHLLINFLASPLITKISTQALI